MAASAASWAGDDAARIRGIVETAIRPVMAEHDVPGMAVALTIDGQAFYFNYGLASKQGNVPVTERTLFELGSISKTFTGLLAAYAQVSGKLSLADHPGKFMPRLKGSAIDRAKLLHLGTYTAGGLPLQFPDDIMDEAQTTSYFQAWAPDAEPGKFRRYSNPSIGLLGHIAALALDGDFAEAIETRLFPELGLNSSYVRVPQEAMADYAWGYDQANNPIRVNRGPLDAQAYGVKSSTADMIRYVQANIDPSPLKAPWRRAIKDTHQGYFTVGDMVQGLGWEHYRHPITLDRLLEGNSRGMALEPRIATPLVPPELSSGLTLFNKTGSTNGFGAYVAFIPQKQIGIVMLANRNFPIPARIRAAYAIMEQLTPF
ncbi:class C beta-lactamase [Pollutimonas subterranea]|uniref:Beta-lactamase n=1 Tax=Pollutimonas subterranea TaxID=2045210 RepID=A0A2N4U5F2_9BURK|nr:class C beta-lactamase [Pollutimonas subterranea]